MKWRPEDRPCPVCGESAGQAAPLGVRGGSAHRLGLGVQTTVVRCRRCHAVYQRPTMLPEGNPYSELAPSEYFFGHDSTRKVATGERLAKAAERIVGGPGRLLELGCGRGELLCGAARRGWVVAGVDMTPGFVTLARSEFGVEVEEASVESCTLLDRTWDVVFLAASLEHVYDPLALLKRVSAALRPGGAVYIEVPNECSLYTRVGNLYFRLQRRRWVLNLSPTFPPFHVVGFCPQSLRLALRAAQLEVMELQLYAMAPPPVRQGAGFSDKLQHVALTGVLQLGQVFGHGAGIVCWATKPHG